MNSRELQILFHKYLDRGLSDEEQDRLNEAVQEQSEEDWQGAIVPVIEETKPDEDYKAEEWDAIKDKILSRPLSDRGRVHRVHLLSVAWVRYAAAIIILIGIGLYLYTNNQKEKPSVTQTNPRPVQNDVAPGGNKATLTLADGSTINLDNAANGIIANENQAAIVKLREGKIEYKSFGADQATQTVVLNTLSTPRGGQYQLTLPDGSQVWLNAESSITYPTAFSGNERKVSITGEAYFEVAKDNRKPFRVDIGKATVEVTGTHFNVNTYIDEPTINTTLLEGGVRIKTVRTSLTLKPGQQGQWNPRNQNLSLAANPDVVQVVAWKNAVFDFNGLTLQDAMRQIVRWYDVDVVYEGDVDNFRFGGKMGRDLKLSQVTKVLSAFGVKFRIEGRKLIVFS